MMVKLNMSAAELILASILFTIIACSDVPQQDTGTGGFVPSSLSANTLFRDELEITWTPPADIRSVTGYRLFRDGVSVTQVVGPRAVDDGLTPYTFYTYRVSALKTGGIESGESVPLTVRTLRYSTFLSTTGLNTARAVTVDTLGNVYITGTTSGALGENVTGNQGGLDIFVAKFNFFQELQWVVQYGTSSDDIGTAVAVSGNNVFVAGQTRGLFGTQPGVTLQGGTDAFVMMLDARDGSVQGDVVQFGTPQDDGIEAAAIIGGTVVVAGFTKGSLFAVNAGLSDIIVARFGSTLTVPPVWGRQIGSPGIDRARAIATDSSGNIFVAGSFENQSVYVTRFDPSGSQGTTWVTSSSQTGEATAIAVDDSNTYVFVAGTTHVSFLDNPAIGDSDVFVMKLNALIPAAPSVVWSTQLGSTGSDEAVAITLKSATEVLVAGTTSGNFYATNQGGIDFFVTNLDAANGNTRAGWGVQYGTTLNDTVLGLTYHRGTNAGYVTGSIERTSTTSDVPIWHFDQNGVLQ